MTDRTKEDLLAEIDKKLDEHKIDRREFGRYVLKTYGAVVSTTVLATAAGAFFAERAQALAWYQQYEAVIIGSGVGGGVLAARLSKKWPGKVLLIERGKRYPKGSFPRTGSGLVGALLRTPNDNAPRVLDGNLLTGYSNGMLDLRNFDGMDILQGNGYGGTTLIYAAVKLEPSIPGFDDTWPSTIKKAELAPYWSLYRGVVQARPVPLSSEPARNLVKLTYHQNIATAMGSQSDRVDIGVFFGNDFENPLPIGEEQVNPHGATQTSCRYCAECVFGCNFHAKNSADLNYLYVAENKYDLQVVTEKRVDKIVPLNAFGGNSVLSNGQYGYRVYFGDTLGLFSNTQSVTAKRVIVAAGSMGSTEILMRNKSRHLTLPMISSKLGQGFSGNGDWVGGILSPSQPDGHAYGPTITQRSQHAHLTDPGKGIVMEDLSLPPLLELLDWILQLSQLAGSTWSTFWQSIKDTAAANNGQNLGFSPLLFMGRDASDGAYYLNPLGGGLRLNWSPENSQPLYDFMEAKLDELQGVTGGTKFVFPSYQLGRNVSAHPLGGCKLGTSSANSVTSADRASFGQVHNYNNLYVADGALVPSSIGANPSLTIGALAEMVAEGITGTVGTTTL